MGRLGSVCKGRYRSIERRGRALRSIFRTHLTPVAASALTLVMVLAAGEHLTNGEAPMVVSNLVLGGLAAFIAWGRFTKAPIAPR